VTVCESGDGVPGSCWVEECLAGLELNRFAVERACQVVAAEEVDVAVVLMGVFG
jgi:hypothetical protein